MKKNKAYYEKKFREYIKPIGIEWTCCMEERGNYYYCFMLKNGEQRFWTNCSQETLDYLETNYDAESGMDKDELLKVSGIRR
jgi:hypothetical protein